MPCFPVMPNGFPPVQIQQLQPSHSQSQVHCSLQPNDPQSNQAPIYHSAQTLEPQYFEKHNSVTFTDPTQSYDSRFINPTSIPQSAPFSGTPATNLSQNLLQIQSLIQNQCVTPNIHSLTASLQAFVQSCTCVVQSIQNFPRSERDCGEKNKPERVQRHFGPEKYSDKDRAICGQISEVLSKKIYEEAIFGDWVLGTEWWAFFFFFLEIQ